MEERVAETHFDVETFCNLNRSNLEILITMYFKKGLMNQPLLDAINEAIEIRKDCNNVSRIVREAFVFNANESKMKLVYCRCGLAIDESSISIIILLGKGTFTEKFSPTI